jgi:hypothetical protein
VDTLAQANAVITKIVNYEQNPPTDPSFYDNVTVAAYFQDDNLDTYDDRPFVATSEEIRDFMLTQGYNVERIYEAPDSSNPLYYNDGSYGNGEPLPDDLLRSNGFAWDGNATHISNAINSGTFLLNHRDHGSVTSWGHPYYHTSHINGLSNGEELPVVFSLNCRTGWFDDETDESSWNATSFAETFLRKDNGGAVGIVAATRTSFSGHNDLIDKGMIDAIWPDFIPGYSPSGAFSNPQRHMGQVLNYGKMYYASIFGDSVFRQFQFEMFHYFGDPTMQIWTEMPAQMNVSHAESCPAGATSFEVDADVEGALVTVVKGNEILGKAMVSGGKAIIGLSPAPTDGQLLVTAVEGDYAPYGDDVPVGTPTAVSLAGASLSPGRGGVLIQWQTGSEIDNLGFNVYRSKTNDPETAIKVNADLIPSQAFGSIVGASYTYVDDTAKPRVRYHYWLEDVDIWSGGLNPSLGERHYIGRQRWNMPQARGTTLANTSIDYRDPVRFVGVYRDLDADLSKCYLLFNDRPEIDGGILVRYDHVAKTFALYDDQRGEWLGGLKARQRDRRRTQLATLRGLKTWVKVRKKGRVLRVIWRLKFRPDSPGLYNIYQLAEDTAGNSSGWQFAGTWEVLP